MRSLFILKTIALGLASLFCLPAQLGAQQFSRDEQTTQQQFRSPSVAFDKGTSLERSSRWRDAIIHYEAALEQWPEDKNLLYGLRRSKHHFKIVKRYDDTSFEKKLLNSPREDALRLFDSVLSRVEIEFVDPISVASFMAHGTESFYLALGNRKFVQRHLTRVDSDRIYEMKKYLRTNYWNKPMRDRMTARQEVLNVCAVAQEKLGLSFNSVIMEYIFGGFNALDEYSVCFTPDGMKKLMGSIDGAFVGVGIEMKGEEGKGMYLVNVLNDSPASSGGMYPGDYITHVDGISCLNLTTDEAAKLLKGTTGSRVRVRFVDPATRQSREVELTRRHVKVRSITEAKIIDQEYGIGYIRMNGFQKSTTQELDQALRGLSDQGMRSLIWDLRGNPGGLLTSAIEVLDRFIENGIVVKTKSRNADQNWTYSANPRGTWNVPLVVLIDGESASASEIVAGAIKDHRRGTLVGRTSYGKWSVQTIHPLKFGTGLKITTARFYSPHDHNYAKVGVKPDVVVKRDKNEYSTSYRKRDESLLTDRDISKGVDVLRSRVAGR